MAVDELVAQDADPYKDPDANRLSILADVMYRILICYELNGAEIQYTGAVNATFELVLIIIPDAVFD